MENSINKGGNMNGDPYYEEVFPLDPSAIIGLPKDEYDKYDYYSIELFFRADKRQWASWFRVSLGTNTGSEEYTIQYLKAKNICQKNVISANKATNRYLNQEIKRANNRLNYLESKKKKK